MPLIPPGGSTLQWAMVRFAMPSTSCHCWADDVQKPTDELGRSYVAFMRVNMDQVRQKLTDELFILNMLEARLLFLIYYVNY